MMVAAANAGRSASSCVVELYDLLSAFNAPASNASGVLQATWLRRFLRVQPAVRTWAGLGFLLAAACGGRNMSDMQRLLAR
jgi:hypothetical protein